MKEKVIEQFASCAAWKQWTNKLVKLRIPFQTAFSSHGLLWPHEERCCNKIIFPVPNNRMEWHTQKLFMASKSPAWTCHLFLWALLICNQHTSISFLRLVMWNKKKTWATMLQQRHSNSVDASRHKSMHMVFTSFVTTCLHFLEAPTWQKLSWRDQCLHCP